MTAGHVYAGGAFLAMVHDYKVMRTERGWYCLSEVHIKRNFSVGFMEIFKSVSYPYKYCNNFGQATMS